jgi:group I intron endonuclease
MNGKIYCIINLVNGKRYVGQTISTIAHRWHQHISCAKRNYPGYLYSSIRKYGKYNFRIIALIDGIDTQANLNCVELFTIDRFNTRDRLFGYNNKEGGANGRPSEETKRKMSIAKKGRGFSEKHKLALSIASKTRPTRILTDETKRKISITSKGRIHSSESRDKMSLANTGRAKPPRSEEHCKKLSLAAKKRWSK